MISIVKNIVIAQSRERLLKLVKLLVCMRDDPYWEINMVVRNEWISLIQKRFNILSTIINLMSNNRADKQMMKTKPLMKISNVRNSITSAYPNQALSVTYNIGHCNLPVINKLAGPFCGMSRSSQSGLRRHLKIYNEHRQ